MMGNFRTKEDKQIWRLLTRQPCPGDKVQTSKRLSQEKQTITIGKLKVNGSGGTASNDDALPLHAHTLALFFLLPPINMTKETNLYLNLSGIPIGDSHQ